MSEFYETPIDVYQAYEHSAPPDWVRIAVKFKKVGTQDDYVLEKQPRVYRWDGGEIVGGSLEVSDNDSALRIADFFLDELDHRGWTEGLLVTSADHTRSTTLTADSDALSDEMFDRGGNFLLDYLEEHRVEMEEIARRVYGEPKKRLFGG